MDEETLHTHLKPFKPIPDPPWPPESLNTHLRCSIFTLDLPDQFQYLLIHPKAFTSISTHSYTSNALHTHQSLQYPYQILRTHLKPFTPSLGYPHPPKALYTHLTPSAPTQGPSHPFQALCIHLWPSTHSLGPLHLP